MYLYIVHIEGWESTEFDLMKAPTAESAKLRWTWEYGYPSIFEAEKMLGKMIALRAPLALQEEENSDD